jgi:hypothetical protein
MKTAKVIIGLVVGFFATITMFHMFFEETGAGLYGALSGYAVIMAICIWLVYSGAKDNSKTKVPNRNNKNVTNPNYDKSSTLKELKDKGILTEQEYEVKIKKLIEDDLEKSLEDYNEYKQLKSLYNDGILTKDEFENKVEFLKNKIRSNKEDRNKNEPSEGMILVTDDDLNYGFTDINGSEVIKTQYEYAEDFSEGLALVRLNSMFGYIDKKGNVVIDLQFENAKSFQNGFAKVKRKNDTQFIEINKKGENTQKIFNEIFEAKTHTAPPKKEEKKSSSIKIIFPILIVLGLITYGVYQKSEAQKTINKKSIPYKSTPINNTNNVAKPNNKEDSNTNFKTIIWENKDVKNFKFKLPNTFIYNSILSSSNKNVYSDFRNNLALSIDVAELPSDYINATLSELIPDIYSFGREINAENKKQFYDFNLIKTGYAKIGNANSILVNQTSTTISESNQLMKVDSYFALSFPYYLSVTVSYPANSPSSESVVKEIVNSFNFPETIKAKVEVINKTETSDKSRETKYISRPSSIDTKNWILSKFKSYGNPDFTYRINGWNLIITTTTNPKTAIEYTIPLCDANVYKNTSHTFSTERITVSTKKERIKIDRDWKGFPHFKSSFDFDFRFSSEANLISKLNEALDHLEYYCLND